MSSGCLAEEHGPVIVLRVVPEALSRLGVEVEHLARVLGLAGLPGLGQGGTHGLVRDPEQVVVLPLHQAQPARVVPNLVRRGHVT